LLLFAALAVVTPRQTSAEFEMLAAMAVLQLVSWRVPTLNTRRGNLLVITLKLLVAFLLIGVTGGILSNYYLLLLVPVVSAATTLGTFGATLFTIVSGASYLTFVPLAYSLGYDLSPDLLRELSLRVILLLVVGYLTYQLAQSNRLEARRAQAAAAQLAQANQDLRAAEDAIRRSERLAALGQLTAGLAHELRNPMGTMKASAELLLRRIDPSDEIGREVAGYIASEVDRTNSLITRFLEFARPLQLRRQSTDLNDLVDRVITQIQRQGFAQGAEIHKNYAPDIPPIQLDAELFERVVHNLIQNAIEASPQGGSVTIKTRVVNNVVELSVLDRGAGIAPENRELVFNPFFTTKSTGVGLGLAIVSKIVDEHGGRITVESNLGKGAIFLVRLPSPALGESTDPPRTPG
jgi:two-component system, NtrC family, sensor histidine kinase HydH